MKLTPAEDKTIKWYSEQALEWAQKHGFAGDKYLMFQPEMDMLFELVPKGKVLEIGTGHGGDAIELIAHYGKENYIGVDAAEGLLKIAKHRNPGGDFILMNIYDLNFPEETFDGFWISAMMIHIPKSRLHDALKKVHFVTKIGGVGFFSVMEGDADMVESRPGRHYSLWSQNEFAQGLKNAGFEVIRQRRIERASGSPWLTYLVKKK